MKKKNLFILSIVLLLSACGNRPQESWRDAYTALLWQYYAATVHLEAEERWMFALHDINQDGTPELIIWESMFGGFFFAVQSVYTFVDGIVHGLEIDEDFGGRPASLSVFSPPDDTPGIIVVGGGEGFSRYMFINMEEYRLVISVCITSSTLPRHRGYDNILYYIRGMEVTSSELPYYLYWLEEEHDRMTSNDYVLVTEMEFHKARDAVFGLMLDNDRSVPQIITETNFNGTHGS